MSKLLILELRVLSLGLSLAETVMVTALHEVVFVRIAEIPAVIIETVCSRRLVLDWLGLYIVLWW